MEKPAFETSSHALLSGSDRNAMHASAERAMQRKVEIGIGCALACLVVIGVVSFVTVDRLRSDAAWVEHTHEVIGRLDAVVANNFDAQSARRGFAASGDEAYLASYHPAVERMPEDLEQLRRLTADNAERQRQMSALEALATEQIALGRAIIAERRERGLEAALGVMALREGGRINDGLRELVAEMKRAEEMLLHEREARAARSAMIARSVIVLGSLVAFGVTGVALLAIRGDFAGRRRAERALRESEESLAVTLQSIGDAVLATDTTGRITRMNRVAEQLTGWTAAEAAGRPIGEVFRIVNEQTRAPAIIPVEQVLATGEIQGLANHTVLIARDGAERAIEDSAAPIRDRAGRIRGVVLAFRDVTSERAAEVKLEGVRGELERERTRLQRVFDAVPVGISFVVTEPDGRRTRLINDAHLRICGLTRGEVESQETFLRITHPDDRAVQAELVRRLEAGTIDRGSFDKRYVRADGKIVWVMLSFQRWKRPDGFCEDLSIVVDITERKEAVAQLERFFELSLDFLCISSADGYFKRVSPAVTDILGWEVAEFLARPYLDFVHPDDVAATIAEVQKQVLAGEKVMQFENRYRHKDGSWRVLSWRSVPQPDGLMYATARDVTERNRVQTEIERLNTDLQRQAVQLEAANRELEAFSYSVSHDLRAPLRHIQGFVGMLAREAGTQLSEKALRYLKTISDAGREMGQLIDDLLGFSRMARTELHETVVDPAQLVAAVRKDLELAERDRAIEWKVQPLPRVRADAAMLKQVWANLLGNAVKYTRGRTPARIEVGCAGEEAGRAIFFVRDNGAGFDMKYADKLFGVFQRLHRAEEFEGTGIGLANVRRIVTRHGGRTWAEGLPNAGATFYFTLQSAEPPLGSAESSR